MYHRLPIPSFYAEWLAGILGLAAMAILLIPASLHNIKVPQISLVFLLLSGIITIQWIIGILHSAQYTLLILSYLIWAFLLTLVGSHFRQEIGWERLTSALAWPLVIAGIINGGIVVLQIVDRTGGTILFLPYLPDYGAIAQANHFADFTALSTISLIYLYAKGRFSIGFLILILIWFLMMLAFSGSRSSWLYLIAIAALAFLMRTNTLKSNNESPATSSLLLITLLTLPVFALIQLFTYYIAPDDLVRLTTSRLVDGAVADTPSARLHVWYDSLRLFLQSPWLGTGVGSMKAKTFLLLDTPTAMASKHIFEHAHNLFLHLLTEMGIGGFLIVISGFIGWILAFKWRELNLETWWLIGLLAVLGIHSMLEYPLWYAYFLGIAAILLGAGDEKLLAINLQIITKKFSKKLSLARLGLVIVLLLGAVNLSTMLVANLKLEDTLSQLESADTNKQKESLAWVKNYSLLSPYAELIHAISTVVDHNDIDNQILLNQSAMNFSPLRKIAYQHVLLLELQRDHAGAKRLLERTLIVYPYDNKYLNMYIPFQYRQEFLKVLSEVSHALPSKKIINNEL
jgi:O-antigen ligase